MSVVSFAADDTITALVSTLRAATGFRAPTETGTDVPVFDGPVYGSGPNHAVVVIGADGLEENQRPVRFTTTWHDMDLTTEESGVITCAVVVWSGDANPTTVATQRATAVGILQDVDTACRASNVATMLGTTTLLWSQIDGGEIFVTFADGTETRLVFAYSYRALLQVT